MSDRTPTSDPERPATPRGEFVAGARSMVPFLISAFPLGVIGGTLGLASWAVATVVGMVAGHLLPEWLRDGLDFPMTAVFLVVLAGALAGWKIWSAAVSAGALAMLTLGLPYNLGLIVAALGGACVGMACERIERRWFPPKPADPPDDPDPAVPEVTAGAGEPVAGPQPPPVPRGRPGEPVRPGERVADAAADVDGR
ncbi:hypothetical protein [Micromonospora sp. RTGN7]|uniref:hypothetical protein n=1 Tax=Micromonospora sp. RTGN7 TaxID=3016526 RepID=UPI0029FF4074|nr:hypothetical protein [Micromonospora sp. RTGN7]